MPIIKYKDSSSGQIIDLDVTNPAEMVGMVHYRDPQTKFMTALGAPDFRKRYEIQLPKVDPSTIGPLPIDKLAQMESTLDALAEKVAAMEKGFGELIDHLVTRLTTLEDQVRKAPATQPTQS